MDICGTGTPVREHENLDPHPPVVPSRVPGTLLSTLTDADIEWIQGFLVDYLNTDLWGYDGTNLDRISDRRKMLSIYLAATADAGNPVAPMLITTLGPQFLNYHVREVSAIHCHTEDLISDAISIMAPCWATVILDTWQQDGPVLTYSGDINVDVTIAIVDGWLLVTETSARFRLGPGS
jgi:hypothetical protein